MSKISDMEETIQTIKGDNEELIKENISLKRHLGGYKTSNDNYKKQVEELKARVEHYKALDLEGDGLYEAKIAELDEAKKEIMRLQSMRNDVVPKKDYEELVEKIESKNTFIEQLQERVQELMIDNSKLKESIDTKEDYIKELEDNIEELSKPWWKRLF